MNIILGLRFNIKLSFLLWNHYFTPDVSIPVEWGAESMGCQSPNCPSPTMTAESQGWSAIAAKWLLPFVTHSLFPESVASLGPVTSALGIEAPPGWALWLAGMSGDQILQTASQRPHAGVIGQQAPDVTHVPRASSAIPQTLGGHVSLASVTTTSTQQTRKPATRRPGGASSACTTRRGGTASSAALDTMATRSARTVAVRCTRPLPRP